MKKNLELYLIKKCVMRVDYGQVMERDIEEVVLKLRANLDKEGFQLLEGKVSDNQRGVNEESCDSEIREFLFKKEIGHVRIKLSRYYLIIEQLVKDDYCGFTYFIEKMQTIITSLFHINEICEIKQIEYQTVDTLIFKKLANINNYFVIDFFNYNKVASLVTEDGLGLEVGKSFYNLKLDDATELNLVTYLEEGEITEKSGKETTAYQVIIDSKLVYDKIEERNAKIVINILKKLHDKQYDLYKKLLTADFQNKLENGDYDRDDIVGGVYCGKSEE